MSATTPRSRKAKGRVYQQEIVKLLSQWVPHLKSTVMGETGTDVQDPLRLLPWTYTECKRHEKSPTLEDIAQWMSRKTHGGQWCLFSRQSRKPTLVVMPLDVLTTLMTAYYSKEDA